MLMNSLIAISKNQLLEFSIEVDRLVCGNSKKNVMIIYIHFLNVFGEMKITTLLTFQVQVYSFNRAIEMRFLLLSLKRWISQTGV